MATTGKQSRTGAFPGARSSSRPTRRRETRRSRDWPAPEFHPFGERPCGRPGRRSPGARLRRPTEPVIPVGAAVKVDECAGRIDDDLVVAMRFGVEQD